MTASVPFSVTVVVPTWNSASFVLDTLATVEAQSTAASELIVCDDGSTDGTVDVVTKFFEGRSRLNGRVLKLGHRGPGAARNAGVEAATSDWIAFLDSDDLWKPCKLAVIQAAITANPDANLFCHNEAVRAVNNEVSEIDYRAFYQPALSLPRQLYKRNLFSTSAVVCRRTLICDAGGFDERLSSAQDYELWLRISPDVRPVFLSDVLGTYVLRPGNISSSHYWRRLTNKLAVLHRHRAKASRSLYMYMITRITLAHLLSPLRSP